MKNRIFLERLKFALNGIGATWKSEKSFRTQVVLALGAIGLLAWLRPEPVWWALFGLVIASVLAAELFNTALEKVVDRLHPEIHPVIGLAKDCAAGAVLILSGGALAVLLALLVHHFRGG